MLGARVVSNFDVVDLAGDCLSGSWLVASWLVASSWGTSSSKLERRSWRSSLMTTTSQGKREEEEEEKGDEGEEGEEEEEEEVGRLVG